jgi:hypothetical protein
MERNKPVLPQGDQRRWPGQAAVMVLVVLGGLLIQGCGRVAQGPLAAGDRAPAFTLPAATGGEASLAAFVGKQPVLLYFSMAYG